MRRIIAEVGCKGTLDYMLNLVDALAEAGVWAVKGQLVNRDLFVSRVAPTYSHGLPEPDQQYDTFTDTFTDWEPVAQRTRQHGMEFMLSVFDIPSMQQYPYGMVKIASADITYRNLIEAAPCPILMSTGGATMTEIEQAISWAYPRQVALMACTLSYPCDTMDAQVDRVRRLKDRFPFTEVGYSDHTRGVAATDYAFRAGADVVEKHVTLTPGAGGDHDFAVTPDQLAKVINGTVTHDPVVDALLAGDGIIGPMACETSALKNARRSWHATRRLESGHLIEPGDIIGLRPGTGIPVDQDIVGQRSQTIIEPGEPVTKTGAAVFNLSVI